MNKVMLIGNVGQDPEIRYVDQGVAVARVRLATTERGYTLQNGTQVPDHTDWHNVILWRRLAEVTNSILRDVSDILPMMISRDSVAMPRRSGLTIWNCSVRNLPMAVLLLW